MRELCTSRWARWAAFPLALVAWEATASAQEGGIEVLSAPTLFEGGTRVSIAHVYRRRAGLVDGTDDVTDPLQRTREEHRLVLGLDHGVRPDVTLSALLPFAWNDLDGNAGDLGGEGVGDIALLAKYRAYKRDWSKGAFHLTLIGGIETPTGDTSERAGGSRLPPDLQPGSGSWDPFAGIASNVNLERLRIDGRVFYKLNTEGTQDFQDGDFFSLEFDTAYRFYHPPYPGPTASARLGLQWRHEGRAELDGVKVGSSGRDEILLRSGLTWHPRPNLDVTLSFDLPLYEDVNGQQLGLDYRSILAIGYRF